MMVSHVITRPNNTLLPAFWPCGRHAEYIMFRKEEERNVLFNDALNTFYLLLYGVGHMVKDHGYYET